jgi:hypothetical protein
VEGQLASRYLLDVTRDAPERESLLTPAAAAILRERAGNSLRDNPLIRCQPVGVPRLVAYTHPFKIVQQQDLVVILYEAQTMFRQIHLDGRPLPPPDVQPTWMGYSVGRWEGDTLVVETTGFNDRSWLDGGGRPHSADMRVVERLTRRSAGRMDIAVEIHDPKTFARPVMYVQPQHLLPDTDLIEHVCTENVKTVFDPSGR